MVSEQRNRTTVLDHGYVELIETWGSDERIIEAARISTNKGFLGWVRLIRCPRCGFEWECENKPAYHNQRETGCVNVECVEVHRGDHHLLKYLYTHKHMTPFEMAGMVIEVQAPIFVFREWHRHRTQSYNELSARYTPLPDVNYIPSKDRMLMRNDKNKQAAAQSVLDLQGANLATKTLELVYIEAQRAYKQLLKTGVPKELARLVVPVGRYSRMRASANLRNWLQFLTLRMDEHAQWEIRQYANAVGDLIASKFPRTWELFRHPNLQTQR